MPTNSNIMNEEDFLDYKALRKRAEEFLKKNPGEGGLQLSEADKLKLIHELDVYKIELEMQQDELKLVKERTDALSKKYDELFDLHNRFIIHMIKMGKTSEGSSGT
jgi:hypothetical protein